MLMKKSTVHAISAVYEEYYLIGIAFLVQILEIISFFLPNIPHFTLHTGNKKKTSMLQNTPKPQTETKLAFRELLLTMRNIAKTQLNTYNTSCISKDRAFIVYRFSLF